MWNPRMLLLALTTTLVLTAQPTLEPVRLKTPVLKPGEGLAITQGDGRVESYGDSKRDTPMGSLAMLVWLRLEGAEWSSKKVQFKCIGKAGPFVCWKKDGHGRVYVGEALQASCNLAFLMWIADSERQWKLDYGEDAARLRMVDVFAPFLGRRLPSGDALPTQTDAWVGEGDLLRTSPEGFLQWLMEPQQSEVVTFGKRFLAGNWVELKELFAKEGWWFKTVTVPVPGEPAATSAWVAGGIGNTIVVLRLPRGRGKEEGLVRLREILGLKG